MGTKQAIILEDKRNSYFKVDISRVHEEEGFNARIDYGDLQELKKSIIENGIITPLRGNKVDGEWIIVDGHRRYRAAKLAVKEGHDILIPIMVQPVGNNHEDRLIEMLVTATGKPLEPFEQADVYKRLIAHGWSEKDIAKRTGKSAAHVNSMLSYNELDTETKGLVSTGKVSTSAAVEATRKHGVKKAQEIIKEAVKKKDGGNVERSELGLSKKVSTEKLSVLVAALKGSEHIILSEMLETVKLYMDSNITMYEALSELKSKQEELTV